MRITLNAIPLRPGGGLVVLRGLVQSLRQIHPDWHITVLSGSRETHESIVSLGSADRVERIAGPSGALKSFLWQNKYLGKKLLQNNSDVLIAFNHYLANIPCKQIIYHLNLRRFCKVYRSRNPIEVLKEFLRDHSASKALTHADANVFESDFLQHAANSLSIKPIQMPKVIYIGLPEELIDMANENVATDNNTRRIATITNPQQHKDNPTLIRMLAELKHREPDQNWHLDIAGGVTRSAWDPVKRLAQELGVEERITWHGFCNQSKLTSLLRSAQCLVSTSQLESFAMVALEAMARGCPPVVADCTSMPESIGPAGLLVSPGNPQEFADAVQQISHNPKLRQQLVSDGYRWIRKFQWAECGKAFADLIQQIDYQVKLKKAG